MAGAAIIYGLLASAAFLFVELHGIQTIAYKGLLLKAVWVMILVAMWRWAYRAVRALHKNDFKAALNSLTFLFIALFVFPFFYPTLGFAFLLKAYTFVMEPAQNIHAAAPIDSDDDWQFFALLNVTIYGFIFCFVYVLWLRFISLPRLIKNGEATPYFGEWATKI